MVDERYARNIGAISEAEQEKLRRSRVLVAGCGGLGGGVLSDLLRIGVGSITAVDFDRFEESNLNRQLLCTVNNIGASKAEAAAAYAGEVNPKIRFTAVSERFGADNGPGLAAGCDLVVDALDSFASRRALAAVCRDAGITEVYGAISGWSAQVAVITPDVSDALMAVICPPEAETGSGSSLSFTPALCSALQASLAVKLLLGRPTGLEGKLLYIDLLSGETEKIAII